MIDRLIPKKRITNKIKTMGVGGLVIGTIVLCLAIAVLIELKERT